jgi:hypothetical protein
MTRRRRTIAASLAAFALAFAQFAVSAHACGLHERAAQTDVMAHHEGCAGATAPDESAVPGNVCAEHCQYGSTSFDNTQAVSAAVDPAGPVLRVDSPAAAAAQADARPAWRFAPAATPPPPAILFGVLRI